MIMLSIFCDEASNEVLYSLQFSDLTLCLGDRIKHVSNQRRQMRGTDVPQMSGSDIVCPILYCICYRTTLLTWPFMLNNASKITPRPRLLTIRQISISESPINVNFGNDDMSKHYFCESTRAGIRMLKNRDKDEIQRNF